MEIFTVELSEVQAQQLRDLARKGGVSPEPLLLMDVEECLSRPDRDFAEAAAYVLMVFDPENQ